MDSQSQTLTLDGSPLIRVSNFNAEVASHEVSSALEKRRLSPSLVTSIVEGCPAKWLAQSFVIPQIVPDEPDNAAFRGTLFHRVFELFFSLPGEERTPERMRKISEDVIVDEKFEASVTDGTREWLTDGIDSYWAMGARPQDVTVASVVQEGRKKQGLELFVGGRIGKTSRDILGFIDMVSVNPKDDSKVVITDFKTGKSKRWNGKLGSDEGFAEVRQQIIYAKLLERYGVSANVARLLYPVGREVVSVDLFDDKVNDRVVEQVEQADEELSGMILNNDFGFKPSFLCAWCPLVKGCPKARVRQVGKIKIAFDQQPGLDVLARAIEFV